MTVTANTALIAGVAQAAIFACEAPAQPVDCTLSRDCSGAEACPADPINIAFVIDPRQFAPPVGAGDPPRRKVAEARIGRASVSAEPFLMPDGTRGFWEDAGELGSRMLVARPDGTARYTELPANRVWTGTCEVLQ